ncbi:TenA family protein [Agromyces marinus]|uniref:TenA family protein n=1 Tax=Agromyces marinus TaxID=1389020 RepID=UPI0025737064|nr:TenA family protein [Agromyces marinus]
MLAVLGHRDPARPHGRLGARDPRSAAVAARVPASRRGPRGRRRPRPRRPLRRPAHPRGLETAPTADEIAADWWARIEDLRLGIDELPFIRALADGTLERAPFLDYLGQDALYLHDYARVLAAAAQLAPDTAAQGFWAQGANGAIVGELELHESWLGDTAVANDAIEPGPATVAYLDHLLACAARGDYAVLVAAILPCYWLYSDLGERLAAGRFGEWAIDPAHPYASWLETYGDPAFAQATRTAIETVTEVASRATPETRERMWRAFRVSSEHELAFFAAPIERAEAVARAAAEPDGARADAAGEPDAAEADAAAATAEARA